MILLDSDVMIDLLRQYLPAMRWFDALDDEEELRLPGYVVRLQKQSRARESTALIGNLLGSMARACGL